MKLKDFKLVSNRYEPLRCHKFILNQGKYRFEIWTLDFGKKYLAEISIHTPIPNNKYLRESVFKTEVNFIEGPKEAVKRFREFIKENNS